ncbi:MAG: hypothetical protein HZC41_25010 [Chloroflexi bacterium]|nr:hypothetical protein [Chloroflexota bacterium]
MAAQSKYQQIEKEYGRSMAEILTDKFAQYGSQRSVAKALGVDQATVYTWLLKLGLKQKTILVPMNRQEETHRESNHC